MRHVCLLAALFAPFAARAQTFNLSSTEQVSSSTRQIHIGQKACSDNKVLNFTWDLGTGHPGLGEKVFIVRARDSSTCNSTSVSGVDRQDAFATSTQKNPSQIKAADMILDQTDAGMPGGCGNTTTTSSAPWTTHYCVQLQSATSAVAGFDDMPVMFAMLPPKPPVNLQIEPGDQHLKVRWDPGNGTEDIANYDVHVLPPDAGPFNAAKHADHVENQTTSDVTTTDDGIKLENDVKYTVQVVANDTYQNASVLSDAGSGTPKHVLDFYNLYREKGGGALGGGGCSTTGNFAWIAGLAVAAGLLARRRTRKGGLFILGLALLAPAAHAADRPPRWLLVGLKIDRYDPKVDSDPAFDGVAAQDKPYYAIFHGRAPLRWQLEVDWEIAHPLGSFLLGATAGYWQNFGKGLLAEVDPTTHTRLPSSDTALLDVIPLGVIATYRFDWLADRWTRFPLIPYAQIGYQRALWISFSGTGNVSRDNVHGGRGSGWTSGYTTALGIALALDALDPHVAREAFIDVGIQRTSLFAEYGWTRLDGFKSGNVLILTDRAWRFGLSVEF